MTTIILTAKAYELIGREKPAEKPAKRQKLIPQEGVRIVLDVPITLRGSVDSFSRIQRQETGIWNQY
jgi:hypothetical protein